MIGSGNNKINKFDCKGPLARKGFQGKSFNLLCAFLHGPQLLTRAEYNYPTSASAENEVDERLGA